MKRRPKPARSRQDNCAPIATPPATAPAHTRRIVDGSPAWKPQATFALVTTPSSASSSPSFQTPNPSPRSALRSIVRPADGVTGAVWHRVRAPLSPWVSPTASRPHRIEDRHEPYGYSNRGPQPPQGDRRQPARHVARVVRLLPLL